MATYNGINPNLNRIVMRNVTEEQKAKMVTDPEYKHLKFEPIPGSVSIKEPAGVEKKTKAGAAPDTQQGATAQPEAPALGE